MAVVELGSTSLGSDGNLQAYYKLENTSDSSGNSRTLTNNGGTVFVAAKFNNGGSHTTGANDYFSRADNLGIAGTGDIGVSLWFKCTAAPTSGQTFGLFIHRSQITADRFIALDYRNTGGTKQLLLNNSGTNATYDVDLGTSDFHNIVVSRNGSSGIQVWLDGVDTGMSAAQGTSTGGTAYIGIATNGLVDPTGITDDYAFFDRQLTQADVNIINDIQATGSDKSYSFFM